MSPYTDNQFLVVGSLTVDASLKITSCTGDTANLFGSSPNELMGKNLRLVLKGDDRLAELSSHLATTMATANHQGGNSAPWQPATPILDEDGRPLEVRFIPLPSTAGVFLGGLLSIFEPSPSLAASRLALDSIAEGVFTVDHQMRITSFNHGAEEITGWLRQEVLGSPCSTIFPSVSCKRDCIMSQAITTRSQVTKRSHYLTTRNGRSIPVQVSAMPLLDREGNVIGGVKTFRDLTVSIQQEMILDSVADGVFTVNDKGMITSFNRAAERITGWKEQEALGKSCAEVMLNSANVSSCPLSISMRTKKAIIDRELFIIARDGSSIPVSVTASPLLDPDNNILGGIETFRNNTERLQTALILDSVADGVFTVDRNWRITSFNLAAELITGWSRENAVGMFCSDVFHSSICGKNCAIAESIYTGRPMANQTISIRNREEKTIHVSISAAPLLDHEGNIVGGVETFRDLSVEMSLRQQLLKNFTFDNIISKSPAMQRLFTILPDVARSDSNVLILGESGTGKELIARAIFHASTRRDGPFVAVNCGALPETLLESELFGYKAGAFTDARKDRQGRLAAAEGGTLFLDEIGDIPQSVQVKLLRVLQEKMYEPLGSNTPVKADVRILTATNRNLARLVQDGEFRDDLFYRLNVVNILLPPLRDRREDIPLLVEHFIDAFRASKQKDIVGASDEVMTILMRYDYPGNIRELENIIEYGFILCPGGYIQPGHLPENLLSAKLEGGATLAGIQGLSLAEIERQAILASLKKNGGKKMQTCRELGISKDTLRRKLRSYGLDEHGLAAR